MMIGHSEQVRKGFSMVVMHLQDSLAASFYVDATSSKWSKYYNMYTHIRVEIPSILEKQGLPLVSEIS